MSDFKLGDRVTISGTTSKIKEYPSVTYKESSRLPVRHNYPDDKFFSEGVIVGSRTVQDGTTSNEEESGGYIFRPERGTARRMWIVAFDLRMKPVMCSDDQVTLLESDEIKVGDTIKRSQR